MLWSLLKILIFVVIVAAAILGLELLLDQGTDVQIRVAQMEFNLGPVQTLLAVLTALLAIWLLLKLAGFVLALLRFLTGDETAITRFFTRNRERRGFQALSDGMTALASGDGAEATTKANKAERLLRRPDLTNLMKAQAAELSGDRTRATEAYKTLLTDDKTRFVGVRGLLKQKLAEGDSETALKLAEKAFVLKPRHAETSDTLLALQAKHANWAGARKTLGAKLKYGSIPKDLAKRRDAVLAVSEAQHRLAQGDAAGARDEAIEADRLAPTLIPAAVAAARAYIDLGKPRNAAKVLRTAWSAEPHPDLAAAFAEIRPDETPRDRVKRFNELFRQKPAHPESRMLETELLIAAEDFPAARKALGDLPQSHPTSRSLTLMAAVERGQGAQDNVVRAWLAKALSASRGPQWICDRCGQVHGEWTAICSSCDGFDTLAWKTADETDRSGDASAGMLPLIIGTSLLENRSAEAAPEPAGDTFDMAPEAGAGAPPDLDAPLPGGPDRGAPAPGDEGVDAQDAIVLPADAGASSDRGLAGDAAHPPVDRLSETEIEHSPADAGTDETAEVPHDPAPNPADAPPIEDDWVLEDAGEPQDERRN